MDALKFILLIGVFVLSGCDKLSNTDDQKNADANAIGYACRVSQKPPEACMKENETFSPSMILDGWRAADKDVQDKVISASEIALPAEAAVPDETPAEAENLSAQKKKAGEKPAAEKKPADARDAAQ